MKIVIRPRWKVSRTILARIVQRLPIPAREGRQPRSVLQEERICAESGLFDSEWYLQANPDVAASGMNPLTHYLSCGAAEGRDPNQLFDGKWYLQQNSDVAAAGINPLVHYVATGAAEGREPNPDFDTQWYLKQNPDVAKVGLNPLAHYCRWGAAKGRSVAPRISVKDGSVRSRSVSAIIPCYNGARWLADALRSIQAQTLPVQEIIVVDDASVDNSGDIARQFGATVVRNDTNGGEGFSRNVGLRRASGDLIAFLDADDMWMPNHISVLIQLLQKYPDATAAFAAVQRFGLGNDVVKGYIPLGPPSNVFWQAFRDWAHTTIGSMIDRAALLEIGGFNEQERYSVDFDLWVRLARSHLFVCTHEVTSLWRVHEDQQSAQFDKQITALYRLRRRYWERERANGNTAFAARLARRMAEIWNEDMTMAWETPGFAHLAVLNELSALTPGIPESDRRLWTSRVKTQATPLDAVPEAHEVKFLGALPDEDPVTTPSPSADAPPRGRRSEEERVIEKSGYFDGDWYLAQNPDVAAFGADPLSHFVRWGAARGLDPSPRFQTAWYLEQNPDVAAAGVNPLAHYILSGSQESRKPVSHWFFDIAAVKPKLDRADFNRIRETYSSYAFDVPPPKARVDNCPEVGAGWARRFMFDSLDSYRRGDPQLALRYAKYALQTQPYEDDPITLYSHIFAECNRPAIDAFVQTFAKAALLIVHISHRRGIPKAMRSCRSFRDLDGRVANLIVVGDERLPEDIYSFDAGRFTLTVPANDAYEALAQKVAKTLLFLGKCPLDLPIVKVDDDIVCNDLSKLHDLIDGVLHRHAYGGKFVHRITPHNLAFWHFGKCTDPQINAKPDGFISSVAYAGGKGYWMSSAAVTAMSRISLIQERHFDVEYCEDRAIGAAFVLYGVRPHSYDLVATGALRSEI